MRSLHRTYRTAQLASASIASTVQYVAAEIASCAASMFADTVRASIMSTVSRRKEAHVSRKRDHVGERESRAAIPFSPG